MGDGEEEESMDEKKPNKYRKIVAYSKVSLTRTYFSIFKTFASYSLENSALEWT